jgi:8-oxo-dGTP pyrophosphatase MutT (NUDIX family)
LTVRRKKEPQRVVSAGGVIVRDVEGTIEVALIFTGGVCGLPKGLVEEGETLEETAIREVKEETGLQGELVGKIGEINYTFQRGKLIFKTVHFFLLRFVSGSVDAHDYEADEVRWTPASTALQLLAYPNEQRMVAKALEMLNQ